MGIIENLERIREKPEHIRIRYVFACVFFCMVFIFFLWFASLRQNFENMRNDDTFQKTIAPSDLQNAISEMGKQSNELKENISHQTDSLKEGDVQRENEEGIVMPESNEENSF